MTTAPEPDTAPADTTSACAEPEDLEPWAGPVATEAELDPVDDIPPAPDDAKFPTAEG
jgi:hypothetical protein